MGNLACDLGGAALEKQIPRAGKEALGTTIK